MLAKLAERTILVQASKKTLYLNIKICETEEHVIGLRKGCDLIFVM